MTSTPIAIKNASGLDVLAVIPVQLGFHPSDSLVVVALHPPRGRVGLAVRLDSLALAHQEGRDLVRRAVKRMRQRGADGVFAARYALPEARPVDEDPPWLETLAEIAAVLPIRGLWEVRGDQLAELDPVTGAGLGPVHQADELRASRGAAALALVGSAAVARREDLAAIRLAPLDQRRLARAAERRAWDQSLSLTAEELCQWRLAALEIWYRHLRQVAQDPAAPVPAAACGRMYALIGDEVGRDAVMATAFARAGHTPRRLALEQGGFELMDPKTSAGLDRDLGDAALDLLGRILANVTPRRRGPGYALGAAWHWWSGGGPAAQEWGRSALDCVNPPDLADLVVMLVRQGIYPRAVQGLRH